MSVENVQSEKKLKFPKSVIFLGCFEFFEGYSLTGYRTILILYVRNILSYSDDASTSIYHVFSMFSYIFPLIGAVIADSWIGKFHTILYASIVATIGYMLLSLSAVTPLNIPIRVFAFFGLSLIVIGAGGIKPCLTPLAGDQFVLPQQTNYFRTFLAMFYVSSYTAVLIATFTTPILRYDVSCWGDNTCYSLAFFVPTITSALSCVSLALGKPMYKTVPPTKNVIFDVSGCIIHGIGNKLKAKKGQQREHWLDYADDKYDRKLIKDIQSTLAVLTLYIPIPVFWALVSQQGSRWLIQGIKMDGQIGSYNLKPDQILTASPILVILSIAFFRFCLFPLLEKFHINFTPLQKLTTGGVFAGISFVFAALLEMQLEKTYPVIPSAGLAQVRIFNTLNCPVNMTIGNESFMIDNLSLWENKYIEANSHVTLNYTANYAQCTSLGMTGEIDENTNGVITATEATATSWVISPTTGLNYSYLDDVDRTVSMDPAVRALVYLNESIGSTGTLNFVKNSGTAASLNITSTFTHMERTELVAGTYNIYFNDTLVQSSVELKTGGIYTVLAYVDTLETAAANTVTVTNPNSVNILWLLPQFTVMTFGSILFSLTGAEFAVTQAPEGLKSLVMAGWILSGAVGEIINIILTGTAVFERQATEFLFFAGFMGVDMFIFGIMAMFYKYVDNSESEDTKCDVQLDGKEPSAKTVSIAENDL